MPGTPVKMFRYRQMEVKAVHLELSGFWRGVNLCPKVFASASGWQNPKTANCLQQSCLK